MNNKNPIDRLTIKGFKSIQNMDRLKLKRLNVLIGANGAGKSNFVSYFRMLSAMIESRLQSWTVNQGSADRIVSFGIKNTDRVMSFVEFGRNGYKFEIEPTIEGQFSFSSEYLFFNGPYYGEEWISLGSGHKEMKLEERFSKSKEGDVADYCYSSIANWKVFHFHDTSDTAGVKRLGALHDNEYLRPDASNLAAFLYKLKQENVNTYDQIRKVVQLAIPFFDDFSLKPQKLASEEEQIRLLWKQCDSDYPFWPSQLSDGSIRFICLATALLQPNPPSTIIIDEPELGLHPYATVLLASLLRSASKRMQVIVSTQSVSLVNEFSVDDLIIVERKNNASVFKRYDEKDFEGWLFSKPEILAKSLMDTSLESSFCKIRDKFSTPEDINDSPDTAPSKRIEKFFPGYDKPIHPVLAAKEMGLEAICRECSLFNSWRKQLKQV